MAGAASRRRSARDRSRVPAAAGRIMVARRSRLRLHVRISLCACDPAAAARRSPGPGWCAGQGPAALHHPPGGAGRLAIQFDRADLRRAPRLYQRGFPFRLQRASAPSAGLPSAAWRATLSREHRAIVYAAKGSGSAADGRYRRRAARLLCVRPDAAPRTRLWHHRSGSWRRPTPPRFRFWSPRQPVPTTSYRRCRMHSPASARLRPAPACATGFVSKPSFPSRSTTIA